MIQCEECFHDPIPSCSVCEELIWLHEFRIKSNECKCTPIEQCDLHYKDQEEEE